MICIPHHNRDTELFCQYKETPSCYPFIITPSPTQTPETPDLFSIPIMLSSQDTYTRKHIACNLLRLGCYCFHSAQHPWDPLKYLSVLHSFLWLRSRWFKHLPVEEYWTCSSLGLSQIKLLWAVVYRFLCGYRFLNVPLWVIWWLHV